MTRIDPMLIFRKEDFNDIAQSDKLFARKFDIDIDKDILDLLDTEIERDVQDGVPP